MANLGLSTTTTAVIPKALKLECRDLHSYVMTLLPPVLDRLYQHPAACLTIFRDLPDLSKQYIMRMLFMEQSVTQAVMAAWITGQYSREHISTVKSLADLHILIDQTLSGSLGWKLNETFKTRLKVALLGGGVPWAGSTSFPADKHTKDAAFLEAYAHERWEGVLYHIVRSKESNIIATAMAVDTLLYSGLIKREDGESEHYITATGFQFLLLDVSQQIWFFMLKYLENIKLKTNENIVVDCLTFLFQLSYLDLGKDYSAEGLSENQSQFLQDLRGIGLVYQRTKKGSRFSPTQLAINLTSNISKESSTDVNRQGFIVVETNYRVYAYTNSDLHLALIALFTSMVYRFPNMAAGIITRNSVRAALGYGITADQIINYLRTHSHPEMHKNKPLIPPAVTDQIRLWEMERDRFEFAHGVLYSQFLSQKDFDLLRDYARDLTVLVWENPQKRFLVVTHEGHDEVRRFWKRHKHDG